MLSWKNHAHYLCFIRNWPLIASCRCRDFPFSLLKAPHEPLGFGSIVFCKVLDLNRQFNSMTGYEIPCYSFDILDPAFFFYFVFWRERYNRFWLDAFIELFQRMRILVIVGYTLRCCLISHFLEDGNTIQPFFYFSSFFVNLDTGLLEFIFRKTYQHLANWTTWNISDEFWNSVNSLLLRCSNLLQNFWWNHRKCRVHYVECMQNAFCASLSILL